ncbi:alpha-ketoglutarate-dependent dioxygenase AlkB [Tundrisphaera sp. TA3]|uniref:alpha-ketoglutarate-dependent dioxygenase AlkB n=1 Tax=Tundrisphaera sp. TA3 TaxID=3435775 RepID=UPI003EBBA0CE
MTVRYAGFEDYLLDDGHHFFAGRLPEHLRLDEVGFESLWAIHPDQYHVIQMHGRPVETPRWQQAYGVDYHYSGRINAALPVAEDLAPFRDWARVAIDERLNGLLINWYDGGLGHYIGPHHDSIKGMAPGTPIVTVSLGEERVFRLSHPERKLTRDFPAASGTVFVMPYDTNLAWKHAVPKLARHKGRRISLTFRAFLESGAEGESTPSA